MDWNAAIERNREALKRIVAALAAMAGLAIGQSPPLWGKPAPDLIRGCPAGQRGVSRATAHHPRLSASPTSPPQGKRSAAVILPRHLHRAVLRLLRPAEAAARRLVIVAARGLVVELPKPRPRKAMHAPIGPVLRSLGIAVVMSSADLVRAAADRRAAVRRAAARPRSLSLPLFDSLPRIPSLSKGRVVRRTVPPHAAPRILFFDGAAPHRLPPPPSPQDPIDAQRLTLRLAALARALDDLPGQAKRFARWKMRRERGPVRRISPLRPGRPPGQRSARSSRRPAHEVHDVLGDLHYFAFEALQRPDTS
jgi:hypothetical protein